MSGTPFIVSIPPSRRVDHISSVMCAELLGGVGRDRHLLVSAPQSLQENRSHHQGGRKMVCAELLEDLAEAATFRCLRNITSRE